MNIVHVPNTILTTPARPVVQFGARLEKIVSEMIATLIAQKNPEGVGLAAPQVGLSMRLFIIKPTKSAKPSFFVNPEVIASEIPNQKSETNSNDQNAKNKLQNADAKKLEGCLSIPQIWGEVMRETTIKLRYQNLKGTREEKIFSGFPAVIIQHEMDHLNGILFTQRVLEQKGQLYHEHNGELEKYEI